jgi:hypothetical protein
MVPERIVAVEGDMAEAWHGASLASLLTTASVLAAGHRATGATLP